MKASLFLLLVLLFSSSSYAQDKLIVLVRHAEKATVAAGEADPDLSAEGRERAERFMKAVKRYRPGEIYATGYKRTRQTAEPIARHRAKEIQTYEAANQQELVDKILKSKTKRFVVVGHSNTVPFLANLFAKKEIFRQLLDTEYGVYYVIRIKNGTFRKLEVFAF
jgi:2,3-bisphosphoglycerate-dependent phosphoglycerate mutase